MTALKRAAAGQMSLDAFGAGNVVKLDGGKRIRLDEKVDFWPATGVWRSITLAGPGEEAPSGHGMQSMLAFLKAERERAGHPVEQPNPLASSVHVDCDHCGRPAELHLGPAVYPGRKDLADRRFWVCWPCEAWVGCVTGTDKPYGPLAKEELRDARIAAHKAFDPLWKDGPMSRAAADAWLSQALGRGAARMRIGLMDLDDCRRIPQLVWEHFAQLSGTSAASPTNDHE